MEDVTINPYLFFNGNCREAMEFYKQVFGGELYMQTMGEANNSSPEAMKDSIMHARLTAGDIVLMASDAPADEVLGAGKINLAIGGTDEKRLRRLFESLSAGGKVGHKLEKQIWGDIYGDVNDKYNVQWMVNISAKKD